MPTPDFNIVDEPDEPIERPDQIGDSGAIDKQALRRAVVLRRAILRSADFSLAAMIACGVAILSIGLFVIQNRPTQTLVLLGLAAAIILVLQLGFRLHRKRVKAIAELRVSQLPEPTISPDFASLNDGRQVAQKLNDLTNRH